MKMGKKVREYKSGDFIFAKVKGYPAWPARVQRPNGKKYFVYFYGTGETANLPPNMIFDYAENKDKFLSKSVKRRDFNDGVKQIEYDFANNVPLEQVIGAAIEVPEDATNDTGNDATANDTMDESAADTTAAEDTTMADESAVNTTAQNESMVEDSDDAGALVIDEGTGKKNRKSTAKPTGKETPKPVKEPKTPRGKKKEDEEAKEEEKKEDEIVSRSGRKIRPKRYIDEQTEENTTLPSPAPKKRRVASPSAEKEKDEKLEKPDTKSKAKVFNPVPQAELEDLKEPFAGDINNFANTKSVDGGQINKENSKENSSTAPLDTKICSDKKISNETNPATNAACQRKPMKFIPPTKCRVESVENSIKDVNFTSSTEVNVKKTVMDIFVNTPSSDKSIDIVTAQNSDSNNVNTNSNMPFYEHTSYKIPPNLNNLDTSDSTIENLTKQSGNSIENTCINYNDNEESHSSLYHLSNTKDDKRNKSKFALGGLILNSFNVLNENDSFDNMSQISLKTHSSVENISQHESFSSVVSLKKTYKDMDLKSFENNKNLCTTGLDNKSELEDSNNNVVNTNSNHKIPIGEDYFNLFKDKNKKQGKLKKFVAMSTEFGDMGFNLNYSDYIKQFGNYYEYYEEYEDITRKILQMYPNENRKLVDRVIRK